MVITGYARRVTGDLTPAAIIDAETAATGDPALLAAGCLAAVEPGFAERCREGDVLIIAGSLADGPGAEAAVIALQAAGLAAVVCGGVAHALAEVANGYGLALVIAPDAAAAIAEDAVVRLDLERGGLEAGSGRWAFTPLAPAALAASRRAQILARMRRVVEDEGYAE